MGLHAVELTPATMAPMLPEGEEGDEDDNAEVVELSEGLRVLAGSSIGFVLMVNGGTISWRSTKMPLQVLNAAEAQAVKLSSASQGCAFLRKLCIEVHWA